MCSVVPLASEVVRDHFGTKLAELRHDADLGIGIRYPKPASIGPDRLAKAVALAGLHARPGIVIDFGTAQGYRGVVLGIRDVKAAQRAQVIANAALVAKSVVPQALAKGGQGHLGMALSGRPQTLARTSQLMGGASRLKVRKSENVTLFDVRQASSLQASTPSPLIHWPSPVAAPP